MSERYLFRSDWRASNGRVVLAALLGHYAAACCFCATTMMAGFVSDLWNEGRAMFAHASLERALEVALFAPLITGLLGLWGAILISPSLVVTLPITKWAADKLRTSALPTAAIGIIPGVVFGFAIFRDGPQIALVFVFPAAMGGIAFALVVWLLCIRPRLNP
jgi:hypothetical protein